MLVRLLLVAFALLLAAPTPSMADSSYLMMATTTSTDNTGLLDYLAPHFQKDTGIELRWTATGTGKALKLGQACDVDVLLVHAPPAEQKFIDAGYGDTRTEVFYNDFIIVGPKSDPAKAKGGNVKKAFKRIKKNGAAFISRGDDSGTNKKEKALWTAAVKELPEKESWYVQTGQGMMKTMLIAEEKDAYTLVDRGTYIKYASKAGGDPKLVVLTEGDKKLFNQYSVLTLAAGNCADIKHDLAAKFAEWLAGAHAQKLVGDFRLMGKSLFIPNAK